jgi:hypothetical protein
MSAVCSPWTTVEDAAACCDVGSDPDVLEDAVEAATELLFLLSGSVYSGTCQQLVRPCSEQLYCSGPWDGWSGAFWGTPSARRGCGCTPLSRIPLAGHATAIMEVTIDGEVVDPDTYRLDEHLWLSRVRDPDDLDTRLYWPRCQAMDKPLTAEGTFGVLYEYGREAPSSAVLAANELACAIFQSCEAEDGAECTLPSGVVRVERQGLTIELQGFRAWGLKDGVWQTGMPFVDAFLNMANPTGTRSGRTQVWSPDLWRYPRPVEQIGS